MSVTIVATAGSASANSFVTVAEADAYLGARLNASAWNAAADEEQKAIALVEATRDLSAIGWQGYRAATTQALAWPRSSAPDPDGTSGCAYLDSTVIPKRIKDATCELALEFLRAGTTDVAAFDTQASVIRKKVGPIETEWAPGSRAMGLSRYPRVTKLIGPLRGIGSGQVRLVR